MCVCVSFFLRQLTANKGPLTAACQVIWLVTIYGLK